MPSLFDFPLLKALRFERTIPAPETQKKQAGDLFSTGQESLFLPFRKDAAPKAKNLVAAYDFEGARKIGCPPHADGAAKIPFGRAAALSTAQAGHLLFLRYQDLFSLKNRTNNEALLNVATMRGFPLPPAITSGAICTDTSGFEADALMMQTGGNAWQTFFVPSYAPNDLTQKQVVYTAHIRFLDAYCGSLDGARCFDTFVPYDLRQQLCTYHIDKHFEAHPKRTGPHPLYLANGQTPGPFRLGALMPFQTAQGKTIEGALYTGGEKKTTGYGWGENNFVVPLSRHTDDKGLTHVTLYPASTKKVDFADGEGTVRIAKPAALPEDIEPLLRRDFRRQPARLDCAVTFAISTAKL